MKSLPTYKNLVHDDTKKYIQKKLPEVLTINYNMNYQPHKN